MKHVFGYRINRQSLGDPEENGGREFAGKIIALDWGTVQEAMFSVPQGDMDLMKMWEVDFPSLDPQDLGSLGFRESANPRQAGIFWVQTNHVEGECGGVYH